MSFRHFFFTACWLTLPSANLARSLSSYGLLRSCDWLRGDVVSDRTGTRWASSCACRRATSLRRNSISLLLICAPCGGLSALQHISFARLQGDPSMPQKADPPDRADNLTQQELRQRELEREAEEEE